MRGGAIGDFILTTPVLAALRQAFPDAKLTLLGYPHIAELALKAGLVDELRSVEARALAGFFAVDGTLDEKLRDFFSEFAVIISYLYDPGETFRENVLKCTSAQFIQGIHRPDESQRVPASEAFLKALEHLAIFDADPIPRLA